MTKKLNYELSTVDDAKVVELSNAIGITPAFAQILIARGYESIDKVNEFINPKFENLRDPFELPNMKIAVERVINAVKNKEHIIVWGHEDADGMSATALLVNVIRDIGGIVEWYIPKKDSHGLDTDKVNELVSKGVTLTITVDCGSSNTKPIDGIDIIITDHHEFPKGIPPVQAFINPKNNYKFDDLAGVGVAYKLAQAVGMQKMNITALQWNSATRKLLPLVLIGTIADKVKLVNENRVFVKLGNEAIKGSIFERIGISETIKLLNSVSRLDPNQGVEFLLHNDEQILSKLANAKKEQDEKIEEAYQKLSELKPITKGGVVIYIFDAAPIDPDVIGICAARVASYKEAPCIIITQRKDGTLVGECRAPEEFDFIKLLMKFDDILIDWGGHKLAAGFSMEANRLKEFKKRVAKLLSGSFGAPDPKLVAIKIDAEVKQEEITPNFLNELKLLEPYGPENTEPLLLTRKLKRGKMEWLDSLPDGEFDIIWTIKNRKPQLVSKID
ncbi:MAG: DHH family phosphoesterase [bacterium]|nr:DHH family phosphoesterase [bacterium]